MLVLARYQGQRIMIGDDYTIELQKLYRYYAVLRINGRSYSIERFTEHTVGPAKIVLLGIKHDQARIGINAPRDIPVHREEIWQKIQDENQKELLK